MTKIAMNEEQRHALWTLIEAAHAAGTLKVAGKAYTSFHHEPECYLRLYPLGASWHFLMNASLGNTVEDAGGGQVVVYTERGNLQPTRIVLGGLDADRLQGILLPEGDRL